MPEESLLHMLFLLIFQFLSFLILLNQYQYLHGYLINNSNLKLDLFFSTHNLSHQILLILYLRFKQYTID